jgi:hypothetical protein
MDMMGPCAAVLQRAAHMLVEAMGEAPQLGPRLGPLVGLLKGLADEVDGQTAHRLSEARQIKAFLVRATQCAATPGWSCPAALLDFSPTAPEDFQAAALEAYVRRLRAGLIQLHAWLETADIPERPALLADIWRWLEEQAQEAARHAPAMW